MIRENDATMQMGLFVAPEPKNQTSPDANNNTQEWYQRPFVALDVETTGLNPAAERVIEIALVPFNLSSDCEVNQLVSVEQELSREIIQITGITQDMIKGKPTFDEVIPRIVKIFSQVDFVVAYNAKFDRSFLESEMARGNEALADVPWIDPYVFVADIDKYKRGKKLVDAAKRWGVDLEQAHRAYDDAKATGELLLKMKEAISIPSLEELIKRQKILSWQNEHNLAAYRKKNEAFITR